MRVFNVAKRCDEAKLPLFCISFFYSFIIYFALVDNGALYEPVSHMELCMSLGHLSLEVCSFYYASFLLLS